MLGVEVTATPPCLQGVGQLLPSPPSLQPGPHLQWGGAEMEAGEEAASALRSLPRACPPCSLALSFCAFSCWGFLALPVNSGHGLGDQLLCRTWSPVRVTLTQGLSSGLRAPSRMSAIPGLRNRPKSSHF